MRHICKQCYNKKYSTEISRAANIARQKQRFIDNPNYYKEYYKKNRDKRLESLRKSISKHKGKRNEETRIWMHLHKDYVAKYIREYYQENKDKYLNYARNRRALKKNAEGKITQSMIYEMIEQQKNKCVYCGRRLDGCLSVDHKTPLSRGGSNKRDNIHLACLHCNSEKNSKTHDEYILFLTR